jgi:hypothetical protein
LTQRRVDAYWAEFFGCDVRTLRPSRTVVLPHAALAGYAGVYVMEFGGAPVVSAPLSLAPGLRAAAAALAPGSVRVPALWIAALRSAGVVVGPAWLGYLSAAAPAPAGNEDPPDVALVRALGPADVAVVDALRRACSPEEWEHGGSNFARAAVVVGAFVGPELAAAAGYEIWGGRLAHLAVIAHPAHRRGGHAARAVRGLIPRALADGLIPQYRTLEANNASLALARRLSFAQHATSLAVRLREPAT